jgi:kynurenine 3-monooxygenase
VRSVVREQLLQIDSRYQLYQARDHNPRVYRTIPITFPTGLDINYQGYFSGMLLDALPTVEGRHLGVLITKPGQLSQINTLKQAETLFRENFPAIADFIDTASYANFAAKGDREFAAFSYLAPILHYGGHTVLLGDAVHTVKPYFGFGVNTALEDVSSLAEALDGHEELSAALESYSEVRAKEAEAVVKVAQELDQSVLLLGLVLLVDSLAHTIAPWWFENNALSALQDRSKRFSTVYERKQRDRVLLVVGALLLACLAWRSWSQRYFLQ